MHTLRVGNIPPGEEIRVELELVEHLPFVDGFYRWRFPTVIAPRYLPGRPVSHDGDGVLPNTDLVPDASRLQPPLRLEGGTSLDLEVEITGDVTEVSSSLHAVRMSFGGGIKVAPSTEATLDRDFVLAFSTAEHDQPTAHAYTDGTYTAITVEPPQLGEIEPLPRDVVLVIDISGSMAGVKIEAAKRALKSALHGLNLGDRFRLIAFDNVVEEFAKGFTDYNDKNLARADRWIASLHARGGTEMLKPIQSALAGKTPEGRLRTVLFVTDGQAWNQQQLLAAVAGRRQQARFFTMGIDTAVNSALLDGLARVGGGVSELLTPDENIEAAVVRLEARFGAPLVTEVRVDGLRAASMQSADVFEGRPASLIVEGSPDEITITGKAANGTTLKASTVPTKVDFSLAPLWAKRKIDALQDQITLKPYEEEAIRPEVIRLALEHHLASRYTSFVAVEHGRIIDGESTTVVQPAELPHQWQAGAVAGGPVMAAAPMVMGGMAPGAPPQPQSISVMSAPAPAAPRARARGAAMPKGGGSGGMFGAAKKALRRLSGRPSAPVSEGFDGALGDFAMPEMELADSAVFEERAEEAEIRPGADYGETLAHMQSADGSFGSVEETAAALLALILLGHTRRKGLRKRVVRKAAKWLEAQGGDVAAMALGVLADAEAGTAATADASWSELAPSSRAGKVLAAAMGS